MPIYSTTIAFACIWAADILKRRQWPLAQAGAALAWGLWCAAAFDAMENLALLQVMFHGPAAPWPQLSFICACVKFSLIFLGLLYAAFSVGAAISERFARRLPA